MKKQCAVQGCERDHRAKGMCAKHYYQSKEYGLNRGKGRPNYGNCVVALCEGSAGPTGACRKHWHKVNRPNKGRDTNLAKYGLDIDSYEALLKAQGYACAACKSPEPRGKRWHVDHDHACCNISGSCGSCVRGLLCGTCNVALGMVADSPQRLQQLIDYLGTPGA